MAHSPAPQDSSPSDPAADLLAYSGWTISGVYLLLVLLILAGTWALITQDWVRQQKVQETELSSLVRAVSEKLTHDISDIERAMNSVQKLLPDSQDTPASTELREQIRQETNPLPQLARLGIWIGAKDEFISLQQGKLNKLLPSLRPSLEYFRSNPSRHNRIHPAIVGPDGQHYLPIERIYRNPQRQEKAILIALLSIGELEKYLRDIRLTSSDSASILAIDGEPLIRLPKDLEDAAPDFRRILASNTRDLRPEHVFGTTYEIDGESQIGVFVWPEKHSLIVGASRPTAVARASFTAMKRRLLMGATALIGLLGILTWLIYSDSRRHRHARANLGRINASLEQRVSRRTAELEQSNREMIAFSYSISHDLRAPLRAINGFAHALREDFSEQLNEQGRDYLDRICRASVRMGELIDELLALANVSRAPLVFKSLDLTLIATDIVEELRLASPERQVVFQSQAKLHVEGDEALLRNALTNLIGNAWKFTRARRPAVISLTAEEEPEFIRFTLADNGIGFDMAHAKRLFQPFQQLHGDQGFGGTGIGLASVRRIIERHGGQIRAEAEPDQGASFIFTLPVRAQVIRRRRK